MHRKTFKREMSVVMLLWLISLSFFGDPNVLEIVVWPAFAFIISAFSLDAAAVQLRHKSLEPLNGWRTERSGEHSDREDK